MLQKQLSTPIPVLDENSNEGNCVLALLARTSRPASALQNVSTAWLDIAVNTCLGRARPLAAQNRGNLLP